jgi:hypothetical protein
VLVDGRRLRTPAVSAATKKAKAVPLHAMKALGGEEI